MQYEAAVSLDSSARSHMEQFCPRAQWTMSTGTAWADTVARAAETSPIRSSKVSVAIVLKKCRLVRGVK
jgi:hypothetical protein